MKQTTLRRLISFGLLLCLMGIFSCLSPYFLSTRNFFSILREASTIGIIAIGVTFVILTAGIDLSVGSIVALVAMICANLLKFTSLPVPVILAIALLVGVGAGFLNGVTIVKLRVPDFIVTLAGMGIYRGLTLMIAIKESGFVANAVISNKSFTILGKGIGRRFYYVIIAYIVIAVLGYILLRWTRFGTYTYAVGANLKSANLSGINSDRIKIGVYAFSGFTCAVAAIFLSARMRTATPEMGLGMEFSVIAAIVVGGTSLLGGRGDIIGTVIGALFMATLDNGIYKFHVPAAYQPIIKGSVILVAVIFDTWYQRRADAKAKGAELTHASRTASKFTTGEGRS